MQTDSLIEKLIHEVGLTPAQAQNALISVTDVAKKEMPLLEALIDNFVSEEIQKMSAHIN